MKKVQSFLKKLWNGFILALGLLERIFRALLKKTVFLLKRTTDLKERAEELFDQGEENVPEKCAES